MSNLSVCPYEPVPCVRIGCFRKGRRCLILRLRSQGWRSHQDGLRLMETKLLLGILHFYHTLIDCSLQGQWTSVHANKGIGIDLCFLGEFLHPQSCKNLEQLNREGSLHQTCKRLFWVLHHRKSWSMFLSS